MKKAMLLAVCLTAVAVAADSPTFNVYTDSRAPGNHFIPSGWMGAVKSLHFEDPNYESPHSGKSCLKIVYTPKDTDEVQWAGIFWQSHNNNWGNLPGFDLQNYKKLTFWVRGDKGNEILTEVGMGGLQGDKPDTDSARLFQIHLTKQWKEYTIELADKNLANVNGGFVFSLSRDDNPDGITFFLDDIRYEK